MVPHVPGRKRPGEPGSDDGLVHAIEHNVSSGDVMHGSPLLPSVVSTLMGHDIGAWRAGVGLSAVIRAAADRAGWRADVQDGVAMGFAASTDAGTPCAQVAEVGIEEGRIRVHKVTCAIDPGIAVNPDLVRQQCEGSIVMGLSGAVFEAMTVQDGVLSPTLYGPYRMALMRDAPREIEVEILQNTETPGPVGEPPLGSIGAAIANAVWRLTGERLRDMPLQSALDRALA